MDRRETMLRTINLKVSLVLSAVVLTALFVATVVVVSALRESPGRAPDIIYGIGDDVLLPSSSLTDWVSYASQVSVVTVVGEEELPTHPEIDGERGGGYVGRRVDLHIDETLWTYPGSDPETGTISFVANGWIRKEEAMIPFGTPGAARLEVGNTYVVPLVRYEAGWGWLSAETILPVDPSPVDSALRVNVDPFRIHSPTSQRLHGKSFSELTETLDATTPDPVAARFAHLPSVERFDARHREAIPDFVD